MINNGLILRICDATDNNIDFVTKLTSIINQVFLVAEAEIWKENHQRINVELLADMIINREIMVAEVNNVIAGCVQIKFLSNNIAKFGMLTVAPVYKGKKLGSVLVKEVEQYAFKKGRSKMRLELLSPKERPNAGKQFLLKWYNRIGYDFLRQLSFEEIDPRESKNLKTPCFFNLYQKDLLLEN